VAPCSTQRCTRTGTVPRNNGLLTTTSGTFPPLSRDASVAPRGQGDNDDPHATCPLPPRNRRPHQWRDQTRGTGGVTALSCPSSSPPLACDSNRPGCDDPNHPAQAHAEQRNGIGLVPNLCSAASLVPRLPRQRRQAAGGPIVSPSRPLSKLLHETDLLCFPPSPPCHCQPGAPPPPPSLFLLHDGLISSSSKELEHQLYHQTTTAKFTAPQHSPPWPTSRRRLILIISSSRTR
jgi:hypothetical protein